MTTRERSSDEPWPTAAGAGGSVRPIGPVYLRRVVIEAVQPEIDAGRFPIKRVVGEAVEVRADIFTDGHDHLAAVLRWRRSSDLAWREVPMRLLENDRWSAAFHVSALGRYEYTLEAWVDQFASWTAGLAKKHEVGQDVESELLEGAELLRAAEGRATPSDAAWLRDRVAVLAGSADQAARVASAVAPDLAAVMGRCPNRQTATSYPRLLRVVVEPERARCSAWYELFPRSCGAPGVHGTLRDCAARVPLIAAMGFDVLYLPPIHPVGQTHRKGKNNAPVAQPDDVGSPWAIGAEGGGHTAVHPQLGTVADFDQLVATARQHHIEVALDIAFQCSPDHPYVRDHPEWFRHRPDGTLQYAENPPKKYEDIYPLSFETAQRDALWQEAKNVFRFWMAHGVRVFRVDNPHTKPFDFWEWVIAELKREDPAVLFLSEAFTRPKLMRYLAKCGFSQSYTYFTWRTTKPELTEYLTELTQTAVREYLRPNLFANTPDILHESLQTGGRAAFQTRLVLAATLGASYGIYGPAFELCETRAVPSTEEYLDSEKYQLRQWNLEQPGNLRELIGCVNHIRRQNPALWSNDSLHFYPADNPELICYGKSTANLDNVIVVVVNLDPHHTQSGWVTLPVEALGLDPQQPYQVHDLLTNARYLWHSATNYVALDPTVVPAHIFRLRRHARTERDFDYFV